MITVALDAMGGDFGPRVTVPAAVQALSYFPELKIILVGDQAQITSYLKEHTHLLTERLSIIHAEQVISEQDKLSFVLRNSQHSSMSMAIDAVANQHASACVSGGSTAALMALSKMRLKLIDGIERPALISAIPTASGKRSWMLDLGANVSVDADTLAQFALMGNALATAYLFEPSINNKIINSLATDHSPKSHLPKVALLNIGEEEMKGNDVIKRCSEILRKNSNINYIGYIEGHHIYQDKADVIVCDGFAGNISLKSAEGVAQLFIDKIKQTQTTSRLKQFIFKRLFSDVYRNLDTFRPDQYNGASLLGLRGTVIKSHGKSEQNAIVHAIGEAIFEVKNNVPELISKSLSQGRLKRQNELYE